MEQEDKSGNRVVLERIPPPEPPPAAPGLRHVDLVMPCWNNLFYTRFAVESFFVRTNYEKTPYHLILLDNGSDDGTTQYFNEVKATYGDRVKIIRNEVNNGWVEAVNQGVAAMCAGCTYFVCVNNDVLFTQDNWLGRMIDGMEDRFHLAGAGPTSNAVGWRQNVVYNNPKVKIEEVPFIVGFCMVMKRYAVDMLIRQDGYFMDPLFSPGGCDEVDVCIRLSNLGFRFHIDRTVYVHHFCSKSLEKITDNLAAFHQDKVNRLTGKYGEAKVAEFMARQLARVLIAIPTVGQMHYRFVRMLVTLDKPEGVAIELAARSLPDIARNNLAQLALDYGYEYVFFLDDDMIFEQVDLLMKFLARMKADPTIDVLSPVAYMRHPPFSPLVFLESDDPPYYKLIQTKDQGLVDVDATTCAATLVRASVFRRMKRPWFEWVRVGTERMGEDVSFCHKVKHEIGGRVVVDTDEHIHHIGEPLLVSRSTYEKFHKEQPLLRELLKF